MSCPVLLLIIYSCIKFQNVLIDNFNLREICGEWLTYFPLFSKKSEKN
jgi:hypothetical protein